MSNHIPNHPPGGAAEPTTEEVEGTGLLLTIDSEEDADIMARWCRSHFQFQKRNSTPDGREAAIARAVFARSSFDIPEWLDTDQ